MRPTIALLAALITSLAVPALAQDIPPCRQGEPQRQCIKKFGNVSMLLDSSDDRSIKRAIIFSDDMKRDGKDVLLAAGFLMMVVNPSSLADERGNLLQEMLLAGARNDVKTWGGYIWQMRHADNSEAIRIVAERLQAAQKEQQNNGSQPLRTTRVGSGPSVDSAMAICAAVDATGLTSEPCQVSGWQQSINVRINMNSGEARKACAGIVANSTQMGARLDRWWTVRIYSPYSGEHPIATCSF